MLHLDAGECCPSIDLSNVVHLDKLPGANIRRPDVTNLSGPNKVVQGAHSLFEGRVVVRHVDQENIDVVSLETRQTIVDLIEDGRPGKAALIDVVTLVLQLGAEVAGYSSGFFMIDEKPDFGDKCDILAWYLVLHIRKKGGTNHATDSDALASRICQ